MVAGLNVVNRIKGKEKIIFPKETMIGCLSHYISSEIEKFQPMNANFGILPELDRKIKDKKERYTALSEKSLKELNIIVDKM